MRKRSLYFFCLLGYLGCFAGLAGAGELGAGPAVALVGWASGEASGLLPAAPGEERDWQPLELLQRLPAGARVRTGEGELVLVFIDGRRFSLRPGSEAEVGLAGLTRLDGEIQRLSAMPAVAELPLLAEPGRLVVAGRIRQVSNSEDSSTGNVGDGPTEGSLSASPVLRPYPANGSLTRKRAILSLSGPGPTGRTGSPSPAADTDPRLWQVFDSSGSEIFALESGASWVQVSEQSLAAGEAYFWRVSKATGELVGSGFFSIPEQPAERARKELRAQAEERGEVDLWVLVAGLEERLGLWREACDALGNAVQRATAPGAGLGLKGGPLGRLWGSSGCGDGEDPS